MLRGGGAMPLPGGGEGVQGRRRSKVPSVRHTG